MKTPNPNLIPPGGWHFPVTAELKIDGSSFRDLSDRVAVYRRQNNLPEGNPPQEICDYLCSNWPHFCGETDEIPVRLLENTCRACNQKR